MSLNFKPHEIIGYIEIDGKKVTYLKQGVKRNYNYTSPLGPEGQHINPAIVWLKRWELYYKKVVGIDDFKREH